MMRRARAALAIAFAGVALAGCAGWGAMQGSPSPRIWDVHRARFVPRDELEQRVIATRFRLLGEVHDNPMHHALRAELLRALARAGRHPAVVFEQFDATHDAALQQAQRAGADAEALARAGALDRRAWEWPLHEPLIAAALAAHLPVHAGNVSRTVLEAVVKDGTLHAIDAAWRVRIEHAAWDEGKARTLAHEIEEGHCGKIPASLVPRLALAQRVRDAALATALLSDATADGAVLIAGNG
ncbi:MAG TPA: ChaN family lipoprotein, partial [Casimicrobiaceae bacterium]|nr:ChaN family lipoprotein [Casimicrobiaceae bacterium]